MHGDRYTIRKLDILKKILIRIHQLFIHRVLFRRIRAEDGRVIIHQLEEHIDM